MNLLVKNFPNGLHKALKMAAVECGQSLRALITHILEEWVRKNGK